MTDAWWQPLAYALLAGLAFAPLEQLLPEREHEHEGARHGGLRAGWGTDALFASVGALLTKLLLAGATGACVALLVHVRPVDLQLPGWLGLLVGLAVFELAGYAYHRAAHASPFLWRFHAVHHSAEHMDWLASFRQHPVEIVAMTVVQNVPLVLLGVPLGSHALVVLLLALNTVFVHANLGVDHPALRWLIATPRFHHRHHDRRAPAANFASLLPILDRVFGSYSDARAERFGVDEPVARGFVGLLAHPFTAKRPGSGP